MKRQSIGIIMMMYCVLFIPGINGVPTIRGQESGNVGKTIYEGSVFSVGEDLTYEVSWMGISLGTVRSVVVRREGTKNNRLLTAAAYIDSYSGVPFVDLHAVFETTMNEKGIPLSFSAAQKEEERWDIVHYRFDQTARRLIVTERTAESETGKGAVVGKTDTVTIDSSSLDGLSLLFFARLNVQSRRSPTMPTIINGERGATYMNFYGKETSSDIDAVGYPVSVIEFDGEAKFSGIFGLSGPFKGWFSNDEAHIPIVAKMKVIIGSVNIELIQWKRSGWYPPPYHQ